MASDIDVVKLEIEQKILKLIAEKVKSRKMSTDESRQLAKLILTKLKPAQSLVVIHQVLPQLTKEIEVLKEILDPIVADYNRKIADFVEAKVTEMINNGQTLELHQLAAGLIDKKSTNL